MKDNHSQTTLIELAINAKRDGWTYKELERVHEMLVPLAAKLPKEPLSEEEDRAVGILSQDETFIEHLTAYYTAEVEDMKGLKNEEAFASTFTYLGACVEALVLSALLKRQIGVPKVVNAKESSVLGRLGAICTFCNTFNLRMSADEVMREVQKMNEKVQNN